MLNYEQNFAPVPFDMRKQSCSGTLFFPSASSNSSALMHRCLLRLHGKTPPMIMHFCAGPWENGFSHFFYTVKGQTVMTPCSLSAVITIKALKKQRDVFRDIRQTLCFNQTQHGIPNKPLQLPLHETKLDSTQHNSQINNRGFVSSEVRRITTKYFNIFLVAG